jgi:hypothetical protein
MSSGSNTAHLDGELEAVNMSLKQPFSSRQSFFNKALVLSNSKAAILVTTCSFIYKTNRNPPLNRILPRLTQRNGSIVDTVPLWNRGH